jgi:hypothetical protein
MEPQVYQGCCFRQSVVVLQVPIVVLVEDVTLEGGRENNCCVNDL